MFDLHQLSRILELHEKSFALLRWVRAALRQGKISFSVVHQTADTATAAEEWIGRHLHNIPPETRPRPEDVLIFSRLFVSFLTTSFRLSANAVRLVSPCGCRCSYCSYLQAGPHLEVRSPSKKDFQTARDLKKIYLVELLGEQGRDISDSVIERVLAEHGLADKISQATWGAELLRRSKYASQGEAVLALWREFAWQNGNAKWKFKITARDLIDAEQAILAAN